MNDTISEENNKDSECTEDIANEKHDKLKKHVDNDKKCPVKISNDSENESTDNKIEVDKDITKVEEKKLNTGEIVITSILEFGEQEKLQGVKVNLYKINGLSPILIKSEITDENGEVIFAGIEDGCYRIIEIIDKRYFEKPKYINWNEIIIDSYNKKQKVVIINRVKRFVSESKHKY